VDRRNDTQHPSADHQGRGGDPETPERANQRGPPQAPTLAHDRRDGRQVIDVERVAETEDEPDGEKTERGRRHERLPHVQACRTPICASACTTIKSPATEMTSALATGT